MHTTPHRCTTPTTTRRAAPTPRNSNPQKPTQENPTPPITDFPPTRTARVRGHAPQPRKDPKPAREAPTRPAKPLSYFTDSSRSAASTNGLGTRAPRVTRATTPHGMEWRAPYPCHSMPRHAFTRMARCHEGPSLHDTTPHGTPWHGQPGARARRNPHPSRGATARRRESGASRRLAASFRRFGIVPRCIKPPPLRDGVAWVGVARTRHFDNQRFAENVSKNSQDL